MHWRATRLGIKCSVALSLTAVVALVCAVAAGATPFDDNPAQFQKPYPSYTSPPNDGLGVKPGKIKHVWFIILENKSYDASFTGLNNNSYLSQTLPSQGALLENYYGTGHSSLDNYTTLASGQAPIPDLQNDCPYYTEMPEKEGSGYVGGIDMNGGSLKANLNYGQFTDAASPNGADGSNGCVYPSSVQTLFNQLDANHISWKGYAQDFDITPQGPGQNTGADYCGAPFTSATTVPNGAPVPSSAQTQSVVGSSQGAQNGEPADSYVAKHFPFPWFESILQSGDCNSQHIADISQLQTDLKKVSTTPAFSWISPDNCSSGHDGICAAGENNGTNGANDVGGLYAVDLFLKKYVPMIEASPAFKQGGLIDIAFDEAYPEFIWNGNSLADSTFIPSDAAMELQNDAAAETLFGRSVPWEPQGPNTPVAQGSNGQALYPGAGDGAGLDRPSDCIYTGSTTGSEPTSINNDPNDCILDGGANSKSPRTAKTDSQASAPAGSSTIVDPNITPLDEGRPVTDASGNGYIPPNSFVGTVTQTPINPSTYNTSETSTSIATSSFQLVDANGNPVETTGPITAGKGITLAAADDVDDPVYDAYDSTLGGGQTGSVLISPFIKPGTVSTVDYNHYSWLRTMEDIFDVKRASPGLDGEGHLGYAAQPGLAPFGSDVFTAATDPEKASAATRTATDTGTAKVADDSQTARSTLPKVIGYALPEAKVVLSAAGYSVGRVSTPTGQGVPVVTSETLESDSSSGSGLHVNLVLKGNQE